MARKKRNKQYSQEVVFLEKILSNNQKAILEGPARKKWSLHDIRTVEPMTPAQTSMFEQYNNGRHIFAHGSAGTGKSFISIYLGMLDILSNNGPRDKMIIVRSAVPTRDIGFVPGTMEEKIKVYELPYLDIFEDLFGNGLSYEHMKAAKLVNFLPTSFVRGSTWDNCVIIIDEGQNMTFPEINSVLTRTGVNSRVIITGDRVQSDLTKKTERSGFDQVERIVHSMQEFATVQFTTDDIIRSDFVKSWIVAAEQLDSHTYLN